MQENEVKDFLEKMRKDAVIKNPLFSAHVSVLLRGNKIDELYGYFSEDIYMNLIILRAVVKQHLKLNRIYNLRVNSLNCGSNDAVLNMYKAAALSNTEEALKNFIKAADLILSVMEEK